MTELDLAGFIHIKLYLFHGAVLLNETYFINDNL